MSKTTITYRDISPDADKEAEFSGTNYGNFSDLDALRNENEQRNIATLERNLWGLDGSFRLFDPESQTFPFWSDVLSDENCILDPEPTITIDFPTLHSITALTLQFDDTPGALASKFNVKWYRDGQLIAGADFYPTETSVLCSQRVELFDQIVITFIKTSLPYRRVKLRQIIFGAIRVFDMGEIRNARITNQMSHVAAELPVSTLTWTLDSRGDVDFMFQFKQPVEVKNDDFLIGVYYIDEVTRSSSSVYNLRCEDALGVLDSDMIQGGMYVDYSAKQLLTETVGEDFEIDFGDVEDKLLTGLLTPMSKRSAIQNIIFGWGVGLATDGGSVLRVFDLQDAPKYIGHERVYTGVSVETSSEITSLTITAHDYKEDANGGIEVNGKKYSDTTTKYTINNDEITQNVKTNAIEVDGAAFINSSNVGQVAIRIYQYFMCRETARAKIVWNGELLGDKVDVPDAWGTSHIGNIEQMNITLSNTVAAELEVLSGYSNVSRLFPHENRVVITESGTWNVPEGVSVIRLILIGKGEDGERGANGTFSSAGADGADGLGGRVWERTVYVSENQQFDVSIDENTVFGEYSSANGEVYPDGYSDIMSGTSCARAGVASPVPGSGDGGKGGSGGEKGERHSPTGWMSDMVIDKKPGEGSAGVKGATGCVIIYYDKED